MNLLAFQSLCRHVSQSLAADDVDALGESRPTPIQGETFQLLWQPEGRSAVLLTYLGRVSDEHARQVYEQLLLVQLLHQLLLLLLMLKLQLLCPPCCMLLALLQLLLCLFQLAL